MLVIIYTSGHVRFLRENGIERTNVDPIIRFTILVEKEKREEC